MCTYVKYKNLKIMNNYNNGKFNNNNINMIIIK